MISTVLMAAVITTAHSTAAAWGADGHRLVAEVAEAQLTPQAASEVNRLLALEPGATLVSISNWADEFRSPATAAWHYVNFGREAGCSYEAAPICVEGTCVVGAINRQLGVLGSNAPDEQRLKALKYVVHFVADVHQPLHAGYADDRGGNRYQLQAFGKGSNLHALWDTLLIQNWRGGQSALSDAVERAAGIVDSGANEPKAWAEQSCQIVATDGFYPDGRMIDTGYVERWSPTLSNQLGLAARRLAIALNRALRDR